MFYVYIAHEYIYHNVWQLTPRFITSFTHSLTCIRVLINLVIHPCNYLLMIRSFIHSFIHSFIYSFIQSFIHSFIHSFIFIIIIFS